MYTLLFIFWLILNLKINLEIIILGIIFTFLIGLLLKVLNIYTPDKEIRFLKRVPLFIEYIFILLIEIIKANILMIKIVFNKNIKIEPKLVTFKSNLNTSFGNFILANSITLTPGTITTSLSNGELTVHCLRGDMLDTSENNVFIKKIRKMEEL